jgi:hypothetical protein
MSHVYTSGSVVKDGDQVTVVGTVDGTPVTVNFWASAVTGMTADQQVAYVASLMLAALPPQPEDLTSQFPSTVTL